MRLGDAGRFGQEEVERLIADLQLIADQGLSQTAREATRRRMKELVNAIKESGLVRNETRMVEKP